MKQITENCVIEKNDIPFAKKMTRITENDVIEKNDNPLP